MTRNEKTELITLREEYKQLQADLQIASRDHGWNIGSQFGFERRWGRGAAYQGGIAIIDIDQMKAMNSRLAYKGTDAILRCAFDLARSNDYIYRLKQGDELVAMVAINDMPGFLTRLKASFKFLGISFTACYAICMGEPHPLIETLSTAVVFGKDQGKRGKIWELKEQ